MPFLLMVFLTVACLPTIHRDHGDWKEPWLGSSLALSASLSVLVLAVPVVFAYLLSRRVCVALERDPERREAVLGNYERARTWHQFGLFAAYGVALCFCGWGWLVGQVWHRADGVPLPGAELLVLAPFLGGMMASWLCFFDAERAFHRTSQEPAASDPLAEALLVDEGSRALPPLLTTRRAYLGYQLRHRLALVFIPLFLLLLHKELIRLFPDLMQEWYLGAALGGMASLLGLLIGMPWLLRLVLGLRPLPSGPLRDRLLAAARRLRFRCSDILLWNTGRGMANALVVGLIPWPRYVIFTDRLLEDFTPEEVEAVLGHEIGHIRHMHMPLYLGFLSGSMMVFATLLARLWQLLNAAGFGAGEFGAWLGMFVPTVAEVPAVAWLPGMAALLAYTFVVFGFLSRRCERQADVVGCRAGSCGDPHCQGHDEKTVLHPGGTALCPTGIRTFIRALEKVAVLNGISRDRPGFLQSWQHSTIARRVAFLEGVLADARQEPRFQRRLLLVKCGLLAVLAVALAVTISLGDPPPVGSP
jgi:Zn-dependent protease with chaperone function